MVKAGKAAEMLGGAVDGEEGRDVGREVGLECGREGGRDGGREERVGDGSRLGGASRMRNACTAISRLAASFHR